MRLVRRQIRRVDDVPGTDSDHVVEEVWDDRPTVPASTAPPGADPYAAGIAAAVLLGLASLVLFLILILSPGSFGVASEEQVRDATRQAAAPGPRGPVGPRGPQGERGPAGVVDDGSLAAVADDASAARAAAAQLQTRIADLQADVAALCAVQPAAC